MSLHSLQCQWTLQMETGNMGFSQQSIHRESEKDLHLNVELPKILCRWLERENIYISRTRYWTKSYAIFISVCFYLKTHFSTFDQSGTSRAENLQAHPMCYFRDPSLGLRATGTWFFQTATDVSSQHESHAQKYSAQLEWTWCTRSSSGWSKFTQEVWGRTMGMTQTFQTHPCPCRISLIFPCAMRSFPITQYIDSGPDEFGILLPFSLIHVDNAKHKTQNLLMSYLHLILWERSSN